MLAIDEKRALGKFDGVACQFESIRAYGGGHVVLQVIFEAPILSVVFFQNGSCDFGIDRGHDRAQWWLLNEKGDLLKGGFWIAPNEFAIKIVCGFVEHGVSVRLQDTGVGGLKVFF